MSPVSLAPGVYSELAENPPPVSAPTDTGVWFVVGLTNRGPLEAVAIRSLQELIDQFGERVNYSILNDCVEAYFQLGGGTVYMSRVVGPAAAEAEVELTGATTSPATITAYGPGEWANGAASGLSIEVLGNADDASIPVGSFVVSVLLDSVEVERSYNLADVPTLIVWAEGSDYVRASAGIGTGNPTTGGAAQPLAGGLDDRASITDAEWLVALDRFDRALGPGQVSAPGRTTQAAHAQIIDHAYNNRRTGYLDVPDTGAVATLVALADGARTLLNKRYRFSGAFAPWVRIPGIVPNTVRTIPYSPIEAALTAVNDRANNPNEPVAGVNGRAPWVLGVTQEWSEDDRTTLNDAGINVGRMIGGETKELRTYGFRSLALKAEDPNWWMLGGSRLYMFIVANGEAISETYVLRSVDGRGQLLGKYGGDLVGMLLALYDANALFGGTPDEAFRVDVGAAVNPVASLEDGLISAAIEVKMSPMSERVRIVITKRRLTEVL